MIRRTNLTTWLIISVFLAGFAPAVAAGGTIYVDADTPDNNDGSSWAKAYKYLQDALAVAGDGNDIWVAAGTYYPDANTAVPGGGNVLKKKGDTVCKDNIESTIQHLKEKHIPIRATALGGTERRGVCLNVESGCVSSTEGDEKEKLLWKCTRENIGKM